MLKPATRSLLLVGAFGALGGGLSGLFSAWVGQPSGLETLGNTPLAVALGSLGSIAFVYIVANPDRSDCNRMIALSLMVGLLSTPMWTAGQVLVGQHQERRAERKATDSLRAATALARSSTAVSREELQASVQEIRKAIQRTQRAVGTIDSLAARQRIAAELDKLWSSSTKLELPELESLAAVLYSMSRPERENRTRQQRHAETRALTDALKRISDEVEAVREEAQVARAQAKRKQVREMAKLDEVVSALARATTTIRAGAGASAQPVSLPVPSPAHTSKSAIRAEVEELENELVLALADVEVARAEAEAARADVETARAEADAAKFNCQ